MKVTGFKTTMVRVPYEETRAGTHILLQLNTDDGVQGVAYITPLVQFTQKPLRVAIESLAERVIGQDPMAAESINAGFIGGRVTRPQFDGLMRSAASVVDIALWDLKAKAQGLPLWRALGATNNKVRTYASWNLWFNYDLETLGAHAAEHVDNGFRAMKFRLGGVKTAEECVARARTLREAVGPEVELHVDMNWGWTVDKTIRIGKLMEPQRLFWIEDPIPANDYEGLRMISQSLDTPICAGETYHEPSQFRSALDRHALDIVMIDLEVGGITQWLRDAAIVQSYGAPVASHMCTEVSAHVVAAVDGLTCEYIPWAIPLFKEVPPVEDGHIVLSERPGLGVEFDEAAIKKYEL